MTEFEWDMFRYLRVAGVPEDKLWPTVTFINKRVREVAEKDAIKLATNNEWFKLAPTPWYRKLFKRK
jgi:hypothetical protein